MWWLKHWLILEIHTGVAVCMTRDTLEFHPRHTTLFFKSIIVLYHTKANCRCSWIYPLWSIFFQGSGMIKKSEDRGPFSSFSVFPLTQATCAAILWALQSTKLSLSLYLFQTQAFIQTACASLSTFCESLCLSSLWAPGQTLLFIFLSESNESHMHTDFCIYTLTQTPLYLRQSIPAFTPTRSPLQSLALFFFKSFFLS